MAVSEPLILITIKYETAYGETPSQRFLSGVNSVVFNNDLLPQLTQNGMTFKGWSYNGEIISEGYEMSIVGDTTITLVAIWEEQKTYLLTDKSDLIAIADAIREISGNEDKMELTHMPELIKNTNIKENCTIEIIAKMPCIAYTYYDNIGEKQIGIISHETVDSLLVAKNSLIYINYYQGYKTHAIEGGVEIVDVTMGGNQTHIYFVRDNGKIDAPPYSWGGPEVS